MSRDRFPVKIGARRYPVNVDGIQFRTVEVTRRGVDQGAGVGESSLSNEQVWRRTRESWHLGAGQEFADIPDDSSAFRFHESHGIDPWTRRSLTLLPLCHQKRSYAGTIYDMLGVGDYLYIVENDKVYRTTDPTVAVPTWTEVTGFAAGQAIGKITAGGGYFFATNGLDVYRGLLSGTTVTVLSTEDASLLRYCHGRLLASTGAELFELSAAGVKTTVYTHPDSAFRWNGAIEGPGCIYLWGHTLLNIIRSEVFVLTVNNTTGALAAPNHATSLPNGERVRDMAILANVVAIKSSSGVRLATPNPDTKQLTYGPAIVLGDEATADTVGGIVAGSDGFYVTLGNIVHTRLATTSEHAGLVRLRPDRFTDTLIPAYAEDLTVSIDASPAAVAWAKDKPFFSLQSNGIYGGHPTSQIGTGELASGWFSWSVPEVKQVDHVRVHTETQDADTSVTAAMFGSESASALATASVADLARTAVAFAAGDNRVERAYARVTLVSENATDEPTVRRFTLGATPAPFISDEIVLPIPLTDTVADDNGAMVTFDVLDEWNYLVGLRDTQQRTPLVVGGNTYTARVVELAAVGGGDGNGLDGWDDERNWPAGTWLVRCVTMED